MTRERAQVISNLCGFNADMPELRASAAERELKSTQRQRGDIEDKYCHANEHGTQELQVNSGERLVESQAIESHEFQPTSKNASESVSSLSELEDWQLIDMDEHFMSNGVCLNNNNLCDYDKSSLKSREKASRKYVDIDPLGPQQQYSPFLIHLYTAVYSLLPIVSCITLVTLTALLFTRFYFISLIYFSYIVYDRNTCNRGK